MDFSWTPEQQTLYTTIVSAIQLNIEPTVDNHPWTRERWQQCGALGLLGLSAPSPYGGRGYDALTTACGIEAFGYACTDMGLVFSAAAHLFACVMPLVEYGSLELQQSFLPGLCSGELVGANAITETSAGSDIFALQTRALVQDEDYIINGDKSFVSNGPEADIFIVYATTNPTHGYLGITCFLITRDTPGLEISPPIAKMGLSSTPACQLHLHDCRIPARWRLGQEGQGAQIFKRSMQWERSCLFAAYVGQMERQLEQAIAYARQRRQFGKPIGKQQAVAHRIANMKLRLEAARCLLYRTCWLFDQGKSHMLDIALSKLAVSEAAVQGGLDAIQLHGALGFTSDYGIERMLRDAIPGTIFSGTSEIQRDIIASELGL